MRRGLFNRERWMRVGLALLLTAALVAWVMHLSMERGRLATFPRVDDVIYMARGAQLWRVGHDGWDRSGVVGVVTGLVRDWKRDPPHSPWASVCAAMGFGVFGVRDWAAYVFTGVPVLAFVLACGRIGKRAGGSWGWRALPLMVVGASAPFLAASVQNLKPDYCAGVLGAIGMMLLLRGPLLWGSWRRLCWAGAMFGLALLAKPAMMAPTGLLCLGTVGICVVRDWMLGRGKPTSHCKFEVSNLRDGGWLAGAGRAARGLGMVIGTAIAVAFPHHALASGRAWAYTMHVLDGESYAAPGSAWDRATYYLTGPGGRLMLDGARTLAPIGLVMGVYGAMCLWKGWRSRRACYFGAMLAAMVMAWAGPTMVTAKVSHFAAAFDAMAWLVGVYAIAGLVRARSGGRWKWSSTPGWAGAAWLVVTWGPTFWMMPSDRRDNQWVTARASEALVRDVYAEALAAARMRGGEARETLVVVAGSPSALGMPLVEYWTVRDGVRVRVHELRRIPEQGPGSAETPEAIGRRILAEGDVVLVGEAGTTLTRPKLVAAGADDFYLGIARRHPGLELAGRVTDPVTGKVREVYRKRLLPTPQ